MGKKSTEKVIHESYHGRTKPQKKIIDEKNFTYRILLDVINSNIKNHRKILDIGCGAGTLSFYLASKRHKILGIDISNKAIQSCIDSARMMGIKNVEFQVLNFPDECPKGKFDVVLLFEVIEHLINDKKAIKKIYNLLNPEGILLLSTPSINAPLHRLRLTQDFDRKVGHVRRYSIENLTQLLIENGFKVKKVTKTEGIFRNFLFVNPIAGNFVRFIKFFMSDLITHIDNLSLKLFGESNYIVVATKK